MDSSLGVHIASTWEFTVLGWARDLISAANNYSVSCLDPKIKDYQQIQIILSSAGLECEK